MSGNNLTYSSLDNGITWSTISSSSLMVSIAWNGVLWVGVTTGHIKYSSDGINWSDSSGSFSSQGRGVAWNGSYWLACGSGSHTLLKSIDGINWTIVGSPFDSINNAWSISSSGNLWVLIGQSSSSNTIYSSPDGVVWTVGTGTLFQNNIVGPSNVAWNGSIWVATGSDRASQNNILYSTNGMYWQTTNITGGNALNTLGSGVAWNGSLWVVVGYDSANNTLVTSSDGMNWTIVNGLSNHLVSVTWNGSKWFITAMDNGGTLWSSINGTTWTALTNIFASGGGYSICSRRVLPYVGAGSGSTGPTGSTGDTGPIGYTGPAGTGGSGPSTALTENFTVGASNSSSNLIYSYDGINWNNSGFYSQPIHSIAWNGTIWLAGTNFDGGGSGYIVSNNGINWINGNNPSVNEFLCFAWNGTIWVTGCSDGSILWSIDGLNWNTTNNQIFDSSCDFIVWNGIMFVAGGSGTYSLGYSYNGLDWFGSSSGVSTTNTCYSLACNRSIFVAGMYETMAYSFDGINWGTGGGIFGYYASSICWNGSLFVAGAGYGGTIGYSSDGISWNTSSSSSLNACNSITWNGSLWIACGDGGGANYISTSIDGISWTPVYADHAITSVASRCVLPNVGANIINQTNGQLLTENFTVMGGAGIIYSYNGFNWQNTDISNNYFINTIVWNGSIWLAGCNINNDILLLSSNDGIKWSSVNTIITGFTSINCLAWNGTLWVAGGYNSTSIIYSYDGIIWQNSNNTFFNECTCIAWNGLMFIAGDGPNYFSGTSNMSYSYDGINWVSINMTGLLQSCYSVACNGSLWVACGFCNLPNNFSIIYSRDGINWTGSCLSFGLSGICTKVIWNGSIWVLSTGSSSPFILYSKDGIIWNSTGTTFSYIQDITWNGMMFLGTRWNSGSPYNTIYSYDGIHWGQNVSNQNILPNNYSIASRRVLPNITPTPVINQNTINILEETSTTANKTMIDFMNNGLTGTNGKIATSYNGDFLVSVFYNGYIYASYNYGSTWNKLTDSTINSVPRYWSSVACSSNGKIIIATEYSGNVYTSTNGGNYWTQQISTTAYENTFVKCSADGVMILIGSYGTASTLYVESGSINIDSPTTPPSSISMNQVVFVVKSTPPLSWFPNGLSFTCQLPGASAYGISGNIVCGFQSYSGGPTYYIQTENDDNIACYSVNGRMSNYIGYNDNDTVQIITDGSGSTIYFTLQGSPISLNQGDGTFGTCAFDNTTSYYCYISCNSTSGEGAQINSIEFMKTGITDPPQSIVTQLIIDGSHNNFADYGLGIGTNPISVTLNQDGSIIYVSELNNSTLWESTNSGSNWYTYGPPHSYGSLDIYTNDGLTVIATGDLVDSLYIYTPSTSSWQSLNSPYGFYGKWSKVYISRDGNTLYASETSSSSKGTIWSSIDMGITWKSLVNLDNWDSICASFDGKRIYAGRPTGVIGLVPDDTDIKLYNKNSTLKYTSYENMIVAGGVGQDFDPTQNSLNYSYDGITWYPSINGNNLFYISTCVSYNGYMWVASGIDLIDKSIRRFVYSYDGKTWFFANNGPEFVMDVFSITNNGITWVAVGNSQYGDTILYSFDGFNWQNSTNGSALYIVGSSVSWNGTMFVSSGFGANILIYSYDGINWLPSNNVANNIGTGIINNILWIGSIWIALKMADGSNTSSQLIYSYDGINWTKSTDNLIFNNSTTDSIYSIGWNGKIGLVSGYNRILGNYLAYSYDGLTWVRKIAQDQAQWFHQIIWNGNRWIGLKPSSGGGTLYNMFYSDDGIIWTYINITDFSEILYIESRHTLPYKQTNGFANVLNQIAKTILLPPVYSDTFYLAYGLTDTVLELNSNLIPIINHVYMVTMSFAMTSHDSDYGVIDIILKYSGSIPTSVNIVSKQSITVNGDWSTQNGSANLTLLFPHTATNGILQIAGSNFTGINQNIGYTITNFSVFDMGALYNNMIPIRNTPVITSALTQILSGANLSVTWNASIEYNTTITVYEIPHPDISGGQVIDQESITSGTYNYHLSDYIVFSFTDGNTYYATIDSQGTLVTTNSVAFRIIVSKPILTDSSIQVNWTTPFLGDDVTFTIYYSTTYGGEPIQLFSKKVNASITTYTLINTPLINSSYYYATVSTSLNAGTSPIVQYLVTP